MADRPPRSPLAARRLALGAAAEERAAAWYAARGWEVVARNWRCREGELDLVVARGSTLAFVEVKARSSTRFGTPAEAVTPQKQARIRTLALTFLRETGARARTLRFDVVAVLGGQFEVLEGAF